MLISHSAAVTAVRDVVTMVREDMTKK
jgi:hypothetical protein